MKNKKLIYIIVIILIIILLVSIFLLLNNKKNNKVTLDINGGIQTENIEISSDNKLILPGEPKREGYTFVGYEFDNDKIATSGMTINKNIKLKALWLKNDAEFVTVTFSSYQNEPYKIKMAKNSTLKWLELPSRPDYELYGWVNENNEIVPTTYILDKDINLLPRWLNKNNKKITITVNYDNGNEDFKYVSLASDVTSLPIAPTKNGYTFAGWKLSDGTIVNEETVFSGDTTIIAMWNKGSKCPNGYTLNNNTCMNYNAKYQAINGANGWTCNNTNDYMYTEEDSGGAMMWCVPTTKAS